MARVQYGREDRPFLSCSSIARANLTGKANQGNSRLSECLGSIIRRARRVGEIAPVPPIERRDLAGSVGRGRDEDDDAAGWAVRTYEEVWDLQAIVVSM